MAYREAFGAPLLFENRFVGHDDEVARFAQLRFVGEGDFDEVVGAAYVLRFQTCGLEYSLIVPREREHAVFQKVGEAYCLLVMDLIS